MQPSNNIFIGGADPLLSTGPQYNLDTQMQELSRMKALLSQKEQNLVQMKAQMGQNNEQHTSNTPVWDEIDKIIQELSDAEYEFLMNNQEFVDSSNNIAAILQAAYMEMMRPVVERSQKGKDALESHLTLVKRLKKAASAETNKQMADFREYMEKYSDMTYAEYKKMKNGNLKSNKK